MKAIGNEKKWSARDWVHLQWNNLDDQFFVHGVDCKNQLRSHLQAQQTVTLTAWRLQYGRDLLDSFC